MAGLKAGDRVVVNGLMTIGPGAPVKAVPWKSTTAPAADPVPPTPKQGSIVTSHVFIDRPILASVVSIVIVVMGLLALQFLPVAQFPEITPPVVQIDADYPGASAEVAAESVARPIEVTLPGIDNLLYFDSTSSNDGHVTIKLTFEIGTDPDIAQVQTQNREKLAEPQLPTEVIRQGVSVKKMSPDLVAVIVLKSTDPRHDAVFLSNYATLRVVDDLQAGQGRGRCAGVRTAELQYADHSQSARRWRSWA